MNNILQTIDTYRTVNQVFNDNSIKYNSHQLKKEKLLRIKAKLFADDLITVF